MTQQNLPQVKKKSPLTERGPSRSKSVILRPVTVVIGSALTISGAVGTLVYGASFLPILALIFGLAVFASIFILNRGSETAIDGGESQDERLKRLKRYISKTKYLENVGSLGEQAAEQLNQIAERFKKFQDLLPLKFDRNELTYSRYYAAAESTYLSVLDNLNQVATNLNSIDTIDPKYIDERMKSTGDSTELKSLEERKSLRERQMLLTKEIMSFNEKAMTEFDRVSTALSEIQTRQGESGVSLENAMADLTELANRAKKYSGSF